MFVKDLPLKVPTVLGLEPSSTFKASSVTASLFFDSTSILTSSLSDYDHPLSLEWEPLWSHWVHLNNPR